MGVLKELRRYSSLRSRFPNIEIVGKRNFAREEECKRQKGIPYVAFSSSDEAVVRQKLDSLASFSRTAYRAVIMTCVFCYFYVKFLFKSWLVDMQG